MYDFNFTTIKILNDSAILKLNLKQICNGTFLSVRFTENECNLHVSIEQQNTVVFNVETALGNEKLQITMFL